MAVNEELHNANINFQQQLAHVLTKTNPDKNLLFSPLSLHTVLSLLSQGSVRSTLEDLTHVLNITNVNARNNYKSLITDINNVKGITLDMANKIYVKDNYKLNDEFKNIAVNNYFADVENINFVDNVNAANSINKWVESKTDNEIKDLIQSDDLDEDTRMVLINAIYFKGVWMNQFNKTDTKKDNFYITANDKIEVDMMYQEATLRYKEITDIDAKVVEIPYVSRGVSFIILLPNKRDGLKDLEEKLKTYDVKTITRYMFPEIVKIWLPKFKMETTIDLNEPLKEVSILINNFVFRIFFKQLHDISNINIWLVLVDGIRKIVQKRRS